MIQRFTQTVTANSDSTGRVTLIFPAVPQGLTWTGSVTLYTPSGFAGAPPLALLGGIWALSRNTGPILSYSGEAVAYDIQAVGQEVLTLTGGGLTPGLPVTATWTGYSADTPADVPNVYPRVYGATAPYTQVYTDSNAGPGAPVQAVAYPPSSTPGIATASVSTPSTVKTLLDGSVAGACLLYDVNLSAVAMNSGTTAGTQPFFAAVQFGSAAGGTAILQLEPGTVQASSNSMTATLNLNGLRLTPFTVVSLWCASYSGTAIRANASLVYVPE